MGFFSIIGIGNICCLRELSENQLCWLLVPFFDLNYRKFNIIFSRLTKLLIDVNMESNPRPSQNDCKSPGGRPKKHKNIWRTTIKI